MNLFNNRIIQNENELNNGNNDVSNIYFNNKQNSDFISQHINNKPNTNKK